MPDEDRTRLDAAVRDYPDFPSPGITFSDVFPIFRSPDLVRLLVRHTVAAIREHVPGVNIIVGLDARGFLLGPMIALELGIPFAPVRKKGKLPGEVETISYSLEYGDASMELQRDALPAEAVAVLVDDVLATGGSLRATCDLVRAAGGQVGGCMILASVECLHGADNVTAPVWTVVRR